jgi:hypothetical protein
MKSQIWEQQNKIKTNEQIKNIKNIETNILEIRKNIFEIEKQSQSASPFLVREMIPKLNSKINSADSADNTHNETVFRDHKLSTIAETVCEQLEDQQININDRSVCISTEQINKQTKNDIFRYYESIENKYLVLQIV